MAHPVYNYVCVLLLFGYFSGEVVTNWRDKEKDYTNKMFWEGIIKKFKYYLFVKRFEISFSSLIIEDRPIFILIKVKFNIIFLGSHKLFCFILEAR